MNHSHITALQFRRNLLSSNMQAPQNQSIEHTFVAVESMCNDIKTSLIENISPSSVQSPPHELILKALQAFLNREKPFNSLELQACLMLFQVLLRKCSIDLIPLPLPEISHLLALSFLSSSATVQTSMELALSDSFKKVLQVLNRQHFIGAIKKLERLSQIRESSLKLQKENLQNILRVLGQIAFSLADIEAMVPPILKAFNYFRKRAPMASLAAEMLLALIHTHPIQFENIEHSLYLQLQNTLYTSDKINSTLLRLLIRFEEVFPGTAFEEPHIFKTFTLALLNESSYSLFKLLLKFTSTVVTHFIKKELNQEVADQKEEEESETVEFGNMIYFIENAIQNSKLYETPILNFLIVLSSFALFHHKTYQIENITPEESEPIQWFYIRRFTVMDAQPETSYHFQVTRCLLDGLIQLIQWKNGKFTEAIISSLFCSKQALPSLVEWSKVWHQGVLEAQVAEFLDLAQNIEVEEAPESDEEHNPLSL